MRFLKAVTIGMAVLIVVATTVLVVVVARRLGTPGNAVPVAVVLDEPDGTRIAGITSAGDRRALQVQGGGPDRVVLVDPRSGAVSGRVGLRSGTP